MNKKYRKVAVRHDRHVVNNNIKTLIDTDRITTAEMEQVLYGKKSKIKGEEIGSEQEEC